LGQPIQTVFIQVRPPGQTEPQLPQLLLSLEVSRHDPLQQDFCSPSVPERQTVPIAPQLLGSEEISWHTPALHVVPAEHWLLQLPQLLLSLAVMTLTHMETPLEVHNDWSAVHVIKGVTQTPLVQETPLPHLMPQPPQLFGSSFVLSHVLEQQVLHAIGFPPLTLL